MTRRSRPARASIPADLTKDAFDTYLADHPDQKEALTSPYTVVQAAGRPAGRGALQRRNTSSGSSRRRKLLEQAAATTTNPSLKKFLTLRAKAFRTDDYFESELAWMDLKDTPIEVAIGPYEVYTDELYGRRPRSRRSSRLKDPKESAGARRLQGATCATWKRNLPVEERYKNFQRGFESPISVADQVHGGGDNVPGVQTIAFNLPNDERVREAKGAKKVILANVLGAKYERILKPMASLVLVPDQARLVTKKYMTLETLFHELSHSLGPGSITVGGRKTTVDAGTEGDRRRASRRPRPT